MNRLAARNALVVIGLWTAASVVASLVNVLLIPLNNRLTLTGDLGTVMMWVWLGFPHVVAAALAAITLVWVVETKNSLPGLAGLAALILYAECLNGWRLIAHGWRTPPRTSDYVGIGAQAIIPVLVCVAVGLWWRKRSSTAESAAT